MKYTVEKRKYGVGLAAPQVGQSVKLALIAIKPTPTKPDRESFNRTIINPKIIETYGKQVPMWEGCISFGTGNDSPYAEAYRYEKIKVVYYNEKAEEVHEVLGGLAAHVFQHEIDHLNGVLFVDKVKDSQTYMTGSEFRKRIVPKLPKKEKPYVYKEN